MRSRSNFARTYICHLRPQRLNPCADRRLPRLQPLQQRPHRPPPTQRRRSSPTAFKPPTSQLTQSLHKSCTHPGWFRSEVRRLYGFDVPGVDYAAPVEVDLPWPD